MHLVFALLVMVISLFPRNNHAEADARDQSKALEVGVVLEAGAIDSSTVEVGAFAVVIYGQGERQPVSGEWQSLATARGYIQAVNVESLTLGLKGDHEAKQIALTRIQRLVLFGTPSPGTDRDSTVAAVKAGTVPSLSQRRQAEVSTLMDASRPSEMEDRGHRIVKKLAAGTASGIAVATISGISFAIMDDTEFEPGTTFDNTIAYIWGGSLIGLCFGFPLGVTWVDSHDSSSKTIFYGVVLGGVSTSVFLATLQNSKGSLPSFLSIFIAPTIGSIAVSEKTRKPPEDRLASLALSINPHGGLTAVATLRF